MKKTLTMETKLQTTFDIGGNFLKDLKETINQLIIANGNVTASIESLKVDLKKVIKIMHNLNPDLTYSVTTLN